MFLLLIIQRANEPIDQYPNSIHIYCTLSSISKCLASISLILRFSLVISSITSFCFSGFVSGKGNIRSIHLASLYCYLCLCISNMDRILLFRVLHCGFSCIWRLSLRRWREKEVDLQVVCRKYQEFSLHTLCWLELVFPSV